MNSWKGGGVGGPWPPNFWPTKCIFPRDFHSLTSEVMLKNRIRAYIIVSNFHTSV